MLLLYAPPGALGFSFEAITQVVFWSLQDVGRMSVNSTRSCPPALLLHLLSHFRCSGQICGMKPGRHLCATGLLLSGCLKLSKGRKPDLW